MLLFSFLYTHLESVLSIRRHRNVFDNLWWRIQVLFEGKAPYEMTGTVEHVGKAAACAGNIVDPGAVLEDINCDADSVDLRDSYRRVAFGTFRISVASIDALNAARGFATAGIGTSDATEAEPITKAPMDASRAIFVASMAVISRWRSGKCLTGIFTGGGVKSRRTMLGLFCAGKSGPGRSLHNRKVCAGKCASARIFLDAVP